MREGQRPIRNEKGETERHESGRDTVYDKLRKRKPPMHGGKPEYTNTVLHCTPLHSTSTVVLRPTLSHSTLHARHKEEKGSDSNPPVTPAKQGEGIPPPLLELPLSLFSSFFSFFLYLYLFLSFFLSLAWCVILVTAYFSCLLRRLCFILLFVFLFYFVSYIHFILAHSSSSIPSPLSFPI